jgi:hypothetical protein
LSSALGLEVIQTFNEDEFSASASSKINFSDKKFDGCFNIKPHSILFDVGIKDYPLEVSNHPQFSKIFFKSSDPEMPFDIFGAAFWLLSRYEEYLPFKTDEHNRFNYRSSLAYQYDFIQTPLINLWLHELRIILQNKFPALKFKENKYRFISTIDVDNAFKYKHKGFVRALAGYLKDLLSKNKKEIRERFKVIAGRKKDPFDCYNFLIEANKKNRVEAIYFFLLGDYGPNDKNQSATNLSFQSLIKGMADYSQVGIHPSYGSTNKVKQLKVEVRRLANIIHIPVTISRQHYSILRFPQTYNNLLQAGVEKDYSMGYTNFNGFRASYCLSYQWYNLENEMLTPLTINPFCISENTLIYYSKKENKPATELAMPIINDVKKYKGQLISIFHNDNFDEKMKGFYLEFLELVK